jgi:hypothetical protein
MLLAALLLGAAVLAGCDQREVNNPFVGPSGASNEQPFGQVPQAPAPADPHRG